MGLGFIWRNHRGRNAKRIISVIKALCADMRREDRSKWSKRRLVEYRRIEGRRDSEE